MGEQGTGESISGDLVLDAGALIALERGDRRARALVKRSESLGRIVVPASVLAVFVSDSAGGKTSPAHVVCCALESGAAIATSDPADVDALSGVNEPLSVIRV